jgi:hypothetical protein
MQYINDTIYFDGVPLRELAQKSPPPKPRSGQRISPSAPKSLKQPRKQQQASIEQPIRYDGFRNLHIINEDPSANNSKSFAQ